MTLSDALVIYFSCGSPFAIHVLMTNARVRPLVTMVRTAFHFVAWPAIAAGLLFRIAAGKGLVPVPDDESDVDSKLKTILSDIESISHVDRGAGSVFEFRDAFVRYTDLATAFSETHGAVSTAEVFEIAEHPDPSIASVCLSRRTRQRLLLHLNQARIEFVAFVVDLSVRSDGTKIGLLSMAVAEAVGDGDGIRQLDAIFGSPAGMHKRSSSSGEGEQIWSTDQVSPIVS